MGDLPARPNAPASAHALPDARIIAAAVDALRSGQPVVMPTETVYGLATNALSAAAVQRVFTLKGRPADNPLIVHLSGADALDSVCDDVPDVARQLAARFWPGPLTLVLPRGAAVPDVTTAGRSTVAVRVPDHPVARALLDAFGGPLAAPSANRSGSISPTLLAHVQREFADADPPLIMLDGGPCAVGLESTVLDLTSSPPRVLRPGAVTAAALRAIIGEVAERSLSAQDASPGTSLRHYAPQRPALLVDGAELLSMLTSPAPVTAALSWLAVQAGHAPSPHRVIVMPGDPAAYAQRLYAALREADQSPVERILIESPPVWSFSGDDPWRAVRDRLMRATAT